MKVNDFPKVTVILRGYTYDQIHTVVKNLIGTELKAVEITMNTPGALETIRKIREEFGDSHSGRSWNGSYIHGSAAGN